jgi:hypothetical protein
VAFYNYIDISEKNLYNNTLMVKINKLKKATLTIDCRNVFIDKYSRELAITFEIKNNIISVKPSARKKEIGRFEQITLDDYLIENGEIPKHTVFSKHMDLYRISLDYDIINNLYNESKCITTEDLCLCNQWLTKNNKKAFYSLVLCDYYELYETYQAEYIDYKNYDFIAIENKNIYPMCEYKIELE